MSQTESAPALAEGVDTPTPPVRSTTLLSRSLRLWRTRIGAVLVLILVAIAIFGPLVAPYGPEEFIAKPFSSAAASGTVFGTDYLGYDVLEPLPVRRSQHPGDRGRLDGHRCWSSA